MRGIRHLAVGSRQSWGARAEPTPSPFPNADCRTQKIILDISPKTTHIILHPRPMRDWTRAVVFGWVGSGSCGAAYRRSFLGRSLQKAWVAGWPPVTMPVAFGPFGGMPSHPSVRHYDRSEPMRLTNLRCGKATPERVPSPHQGLPSPLSQRRDDQGPGQEREL